MGCVRSKPAEQPVQAAPKNNRPRGFDESRLGTLRHQQEMEVKRRRRWKYRDNQFDIDLDDFLRQCEEFHRDLTQQQTYLVESRAS